MKVVIGIAMAMFLSACSSSPYTYYVEPTPIKKQETKYRISEVNVNLTLNATPGNDSFADQAALQEQFTSYLESGLESQGILGQDENDSLEVIVNIDYRRNFNYGGKALNKPHVSHSVTIINNGEELAGFGQSGYTTKYGYLESMAVDFQIAAFTWDAEDEPRDIELISNLIVDDLSNVGS